MDKSKLMMSIIIVLLLVLIGSVIGSSFLQMKTIKSQSMVEMQVGTQAKDEVSKLTTDQIDIIKLENPINTNLLVGADGKQHVVRVDVGIGVDNTDKKNSGTFATLVASKEVVNRDIIISVLRDKTYEELQRPDGQEQLRVDILAKLQDEYASNLLASVYIGDFYLQ